MNPLIKSAKQLISDKRVSRTSDTTWQVDEQIVKLHKYPGRKTFSCSCPNYSLFCKINPLCKHVASVILFESNFKFYEKIDKIIKIYENAKKINIPLDNDVVIENLKLLRYVK